MKEKKRIFTEKAMLFCLFMVSVFSLYAQQKTELTGTVKDKDGELPGVVITIKGTTVVATTDEHGTYKIMIPAGSDNILRFQLLGKKIVEIKYAGQKTLNVEMEDENVQLEEVVITGIFTKSRESYTGAVTSISAQELSHAGNSNIISRIGNIDPAFVLLENNIMGSDPNTLPNIQMRGSTGLTVGVRELQDDSREQSTANLPLFILDGFEASLQQVIDLDPYLVESITLLKDASATALYGSRGANGVMVITRKLPAQGKLRVTYKGDLTVSAPDFTSYNLLNASEKLQYEMAAGLYTSASAPIQILADELYAKRRAEVERGVDTYWLKYPVHTGIGQKHSVRIDGSASSLMYAANISYNNTTGVMKDSERNTFSGSLFLQYAYGAFKFQNELGITSNNAYNSPYGVFSTYTTLNPYWTPYDNEGNMKKILDSFRHPGYSSLYTPGNPLYDATLPYRDDSHYDQISNNFSVNWKATRDLLLQGRFRVMRTIGRSDKYVSAKHSSFNQYTGDDYIRRGSYVYGTNSADLYDGDITANYNKMLSDKHQIYAGFNFNFGQNKTESNSVMAEGYAATNIYQFGLANSYQRNGSPSSGDSYSRRVGAVLNFNYTFDNRYYIDFSGKLDGSSIFGSNNRMAPFWSSGAGWNVHNEKFLKDNPIVNIMRLRISYGSTGSQNFNPYQARTTFQFYKDQMYQNWTGAYMIALGNPDLKWQTTDQFNSGLELNLFNKRWRINFDYYNKLTYGVLVDINMPTSAGFDSYKSNMGEVRNRGIELTSNVFIIKDLKNDISWSVGANLLTNKNRVLKISNSLDFLNQRINSDPDNARNPSFPVKEGESLNTIFAVKSLGIDPSTGRELYEKLDGTHTFSWNPTDRIACGVTDPDFWGNLNTMFRYKGLSLNVSFSYRTGGYRYNQTLVDKVENVDPWYNVDSRVFYDRWKQPGDLARYKGVQQYSTITYASSRFVMKENTIECRLMNLSYDLDQQWLKKNIKLDYLSFGFFVENPFYISSIKQERGTSYPFARNYSFSLTARF